MENDNELDGIDLLKLKEDMVQLEPELVEMVSNNFEELLLKM